MVLSCSVGLRVLLIQKEVKPMVFIPRVECCLRVLLIQKEVKQLTKAHEDSVV